MSETLFAGSHKQGVEILSKGNSIAYSAEKALKEYCTVYDIKNHIVTISDINVESDSELKERVSSLYKKLSETLYDRLRESEINYSDMVKIMNELYSATSNLNSMGVYDGKRIVDSGQDTYAADGLFHFVSVFKNFINTANGARSLTDLILCYEKYHDTVGEDEFSIKTVFAKCACVIMEHWMSKNSGTISQSKLKKAKRNVTRKKGKEPHYGAIDIIHNYLLHKNKNKTNSHGIVKFSVVIALVFATVCSLGFLGFNLFCNTPKTDINDAKYSISLEELSFVLNYLDGFSGENVSDAQFVIGKLKSKKNGTDILIELDIKNKLGSGISDKKINVIHGVLEGHSKKYLSFKDTEPDKDYAFVIQKDMKSLDNKIYVRDIFEIPQDLSDYDFGAPFKDTKLTGEDNKFYTLVLKYIGHLEKLVKVKR